MSGFEWYWTDGSTHEVTLFGVTDIVETHYLYRDSYNEQDGYALVQGRKLHYWLYDTITVHKGKTDIIYNKIIPCWVEKMGYVIDYDNIKVYEPNENLANSVRTLMKQRGADMSICLCKKDNWGDKVEYVVINEYMQSKGYYKTTIYYLY